MPSWGVPHHTRLRAADAVARHDPGGLLYGAVVTAGSLAAVSINVAHAHRVALGVITVLVAYWLAHVYVRAEQLIFTTEHQGFPQRLASAAAHETSVLWGGLPAVLVYSGAYWLAGAETRTAALIALWFSIGFLIVIGYLGAHRAGVRGWALVLESAGAGSLGLVAVLAKLTLH